MDSFVLTTEKNIREHDLLRVGDRIIVGVSGGADSVCLLEVLCALKDRWNWELTAVHVNHGIRGESADADEAFVRELCAARGIPCLVHRADVPALAAERRESLEEAGRMVRRKAFEEELQRFSDGTGKIALAHHADDNAETFLMNLCRGSGVEGLGGIRPKADAYIRPLLWAGRKEIEAFAKRQGLAYREDETNADITYTRNRIRHQILPRLNEDVNARATAHIGSVSEEMREIADYISRQTDRLYALYASEERSRWVIDGGAAGEDEYLLRSLVKRCLIRAAGQAKDIERTHVRAVTELFSGGTGRRVSLPYGLTAENEYGKVVIRAPEREQSGSARPQATSRLLRVTGFDAAAGRACAQEPSGKACTIELAGGSPYTKYFDYGIITERSAFRTRQAGDYIVIDRAGHRRKVGDWMTDHKIPQSERDHIPLLADGHHVYWIVGHRQSEDSLVTDATDTIIEWKVT